MVHNPERLVIYVESPGTQDAKLVVCDYHNPDLSAPADEDTPALLPLHNEPAEEDASAEEDAPAEEDALAEEEAAPVAAPGSPTVAKRTLDDLLRSPVQVKESKRARLADEAPAEQQELSTQELEAMID